MGGGRCSHNNDRISDYISGVLPALSDSRPEFRVCTLFFRMVS